MGSSRLGGLDPAEPLRAEAAVYIGITRREFCEGAIMAGGSVLLLLQGCGGGGGETNPPPGSSCGASGAAISLNHGHTLVIASVDLDSMADETYSIRGAADHDHTVTLTVPQLQQLKAGRSVTAMASVSAAHSHVVTVTCALPLQRSSVRLEAGKQVESGPRQIGK